LKLYKYIKRLAFQPCGWLLFLGNTAAAHKNIMDCDAIKTIFFWLRMEYNHFWASSGVA
jgi:hypothetical protein